MNLPMRRLLFFLFFLSGYCALVYQIVWTRLAFASFGIITPVLSVIISVFMLGLAIGAWAGGRWIGSLTRKTGFSAILFYAVAELLIGIGAFAVPKLFALGELVLLSSGQMDSFRYLCFSALVLGFSILPSCVFMGATFPFMMAWVREQDARNTESFSFLYLANVLGAMTGSLLTALVLVEVLGFKHTLWIAAAGNFIIALISGYLAWNRGRSVTLVSSSSEGSTEPPAQSPPLREGRQDASSFARPRIIKWILFSTGFSALAMEVVWARAFTPVMQTQVYSFALVVSVYLGATFLGSSIYRHDLRNNSVRSTAMLISLLSIAAFLPVVCNDYRFLANNFPSYIRWSVLLISICPLCGILGYLTPSLIDQDGGGNPARAGLAYSVNVLGCILGPLFASYVLLPAAGERYGLILLSLPFLGFYFFSSKSLPSWYRFGSGLTATAVLVWSLFFAQDFDQLLLKKARNVQIRRDYAASVISSGEGLDKTLLVNGVGMTSLVPMTKFMVHLPLALHTGKPGSALIICFGMGTSYRSALSWDIETTAVELIPSVRDAFGFYHADATTILNNPKGRIVIDDGRRYLKRTREKFDVIVIDPPPPVEAAGSSLLYSVEFYELAKQHLNPNGILQAWFPGGESATAQAVLRSLHESFPHVRCFRAIAEEGVHLLASMEPIATFTPDQLALTMPSAAAEDLLEWSPSRNLPAYLGQVVSKEFSIKQNLNPNPKIRITDDRPYNEYFLLRRWGL